MVFYLIKENNVFQPKSQNAPQQNKLILENDFHWIPTIKPLFHMFDSSQQFIIPSSSQGDHGWISSVMLGQMFEIGLESTLE